jgi:transcriptional regulator with XRE-family HTH domain
MQKSIFSQNMKKARLLKNWSQNGAAKKIGIKRATLAAYEEDRSEPSQETLILIANEYNIYDLYRFMTDDQYFEQSERTNEIVRKYLKLDFNLKKAVNFILNVE